MGITVFAGSFYKKRSACLAIRSERVFFISSHQPLILWDHEPLNLIIDLWSDYTRPIRPVKLAILQKDFSIFSIKRMQLPQITIRMVANAIACP